MTGKRIAVIAHNYYPGGVRERREIDALVDSGYTVDLICLRGSGEPQRETKDNLQIYRVPIGHKRSGKIRFILEYLVFFIFSFLIITFLQIKHKYSLVQVHNIPDFLVFSALLPKLQGARILLDIRDPMPETFQYKFDLDENHKWISLMRWIEKISVRFSDHVLTVHDPLRSIHIKRGCPADKISVVRNLPDEKIFKKYNPSNWPRSTPPNFVLVYTGTIGKRHGIQTALYSLPSLREKIPGIKMRIIGEGEYRAELEQLAKSLGLISIVSFEHQIPNSKIPSVLLQSDVGICLQEGLFGEIAFPTKVPEYFSMGLPAIVSKTMITSISFTCDIVEFIPPGDSEKFSEKVLKLYQNPEFTRSLIDNGYKYLDNNNWNSEKVKYLNLISGLSE